MKLKAIEKIIRKLGKKADRDQDAYFLLYFSRKDGEAARSYTGLDGLDTRVILSEFLRTFMTLCDEANIPHREFLEYIEKIEKAIGNIKEKAVKEARTEKRLMNAIEGSNRGQDKADP